MNERTRISSARCKPKDFALDLWPLAGRLLAPRALMLRLCL
jgi:hypothetical protein